MIKVMLVDDEQFVLEQIKKNIAWEEKGLELIGCCANAMDALQHMLDEMPDILITDINMPIINGLELIEKAKHMNPLMECVVLSGYAEFELAKTAMEQGVKYYLLKPFSKLEFETVLEKSRKPILNRRQEQTMELGEWTKKVERLAKELQLLKENYEKVDAGQIRAMMHACPDLSLLGSALIYLVAHSVGNNQSLLECVSKLFDTERDVYDIAVYALNELLCKEVNESLVIRQIKEYTKQHYSEEGLNLQMIADQVVHLGVKYTGRCFLKETGVKYSEYLLGVRMEKAKELLKAKEEYRIEEIAEQIGLGHDVPYFYQLFKKYTGMTPREFRK